MHESTVDLSTLGTAAIRAKLEAAVENEEEEMAQACLDELRKRNEPD